MTGRLPLVLLLLSLAVPPACAREDPSEEERVAERGDAGAAESPTGAAAADTASAALDPAAPGAPAVQPGVGAPAPTARPAADEEALTGRVAVTGTDIASFVTLRVEGGRSATLVGEVEEELRRLSGVTVRVFGRDAGEAPFGRRFEVRRYEVLAVDGERPQVGTLLAREGATWLATASDTLRIAQLPEALQGQMGARVWIVGPRSGSLLQIQSYGIIRPGAPSP